MLVIAETFESFYDKSSGYLSRGHCLLELATSKLPRIDMFYQSYVPGVDSKHHMWGVTRLLSMTTGECKILQWADYFDSDSPVNGKFTVEADRPLIKELLISNVKAYSGFNSLFLSDIRKCSTWKQVHDKVNYRLILQLCDAQEKFPDPSVWAEWLLPNAYLDMLCGSVMGEGIDTARHDIIVSDPDCVTAAACTNMEEEAAANLLRLGSATPTVTALL